MTGAARGAMMSSGFGAVAMFAGDFAAGTAGNMLNRAISGRKQNLGESLWEGTLNAVGNAVFGKKPVSGFKDAYVRGARSAGTVTLANDLARMSGLVGGEEQYTGSNRSSTLSRNTIGLDRSLTDGGMYTGGKQDPRSLCEPEDAFSGGIGSRSSRGYRQTTGRKRGSKRKSRFDFGKIAKDVVLNSVIGGVIGAAFYGADRAVGAVSDGIRGRRNSTQRRIAENESGSKFEEVFDLADNYKLSEDTFNNHILVRHGPNSTYRNKSHFNADFDIRNGIDSTLRGDNFIVGPNSAGRNGYIFEQISTNPIGTNGKGKTLYTLKVVIDEAGNVVTSFPKK